MVLTVAARIQELVAEHGSYRAAAKAIGVGFSHLNRLRHGAKKASDLTLERLGLEPNSAMYQRLTGSSGRDTK